MRYNVYSNYLVQKYGEKVYKLPVSLPVSCPNRDGLLGTGGCAFCGEIGAGYENLPASMTVEQQITANKEHISPKYKAKKFIPYFQNYSNTYLPADQLARYVREACQPDVVGIAIATRPDCVGEAHLDVLAELQEELKVDITVELGLQTVNYHSLLKVNRGHTLAEWLDATLRIKRRGIGVCTHLILNLPWDTADDVIENAKVMSALRVDQVKLHALYIVKGTLMADWYQENRISLISKEEYIDRVVVFLEHLHPDIVIQRLIGRAPETNTLFTNWQTGWWKIKEAIEHSLAAQDTWQGKKCDYLNGSAVCNHL
ncbi:radical SAM protein [Anaerosporomusa subterranea]|uniref:Radical SAM protein n=1 Tax=Anaerosporomusa subterranea TaxID=1794912 RepID=A0A154BM85_ANASB|nr:TIGR01212 family radical SAM protein [Anaerosporomusa subterranea]KYZ75089.1 radical SAM protein [Anaerosporomusa subterranea]